MNSEAEIKGENEEEEDDVEENIKRKANLFYS